MIKFTAARSKLKYFTRSFTHCTCWKLQARKTFAHSISWINSLSDSYYSNEDTSSSKKLIVFPAYTPYYWFLNHDEVQLILNNLRTIENYYSILSLLSFVTKRRRQSTKPLINFSSWANKAFTLILCKRDGLNEVPLKDTETSTRTSVDYGI